MWYIIILTEDIQYIVTCFSLLVTLYCEMLIHKFICFLDPVCFNKTNTNYGKGWV